MGDRAVVVVFTDGKEVSPSVYLHWSGSAVPTLLDQHKVLMATRKGDVGYATARFVGICHTHIDGNLSLGLWNTHDNIAEAIRTGKAETVRSSDKTQWHEFCALV